ncbi:MAG: RagB/SusD family nutrient uptake outer membrane protein [Flavobacteriaceae bacterium]|nr:RagB/SusD family nutrient uptake outer membrane protein [Flavobacteriaceae bacterium]
MRKYNIVFINLLFLLPFTSCEEYLDVVPDNVTTIGDLFNNRASAERYLSTSYSYLPNAGHRVTDPAILSGDEILQPLAWNDQPGIRIQKGFQNTQNPHFDRWSGGQSFYNAIRHCNEFLSNISLVQDIEEFEREQWIGEVTFLKAYYHFLLLQMYGPVVINNENKLVSADTDQIVPYRDLVDEAFDYVVMLLDEAIELLPEMIDPDLYGRVSKPIAAAIKAKVLVTAASPLFNGNSIFVEFVNDDGIHYFNQTYDQAKWEKAAQAAQEAIELCETLGIRLYDIANYKPRQPQSDITLLKAGLRGRVTDEWNEELIWGATSNVSSGNEIQRESMPKLFYHTRNPVLSNRGVSLRIAELFYTKNGVPIDEDLNWDYANRFALRLATEEDKYFVQPGQSTVNLHYDREPRFYADLAFDRGTWYGNGKENTDDAWYVNGRFNEYGTRTEAYAYSLSGYFPKKLVNIKSTVNSNGTSFAASRYPFPIIRLSDLYLLYAEALNESKASPDSEVYEYVDRIRNRAGLEGVVESWQNYSVNNDKPKSKEGMREIIRQERLIELAFEGHRFWDIRRWLLAKDMMNKPIRGWNIEATSAAPEAYYQIKILSIDRLSRFEEKDYLWPISLNEIINTPTLKQNPGWR